MTAGLVRGGPWRAVLWAGLAAGVLDLADAIVIHGPRGVPAARILQSIASGLLGPGAYRGGASTAALGLTLHFTIATCWAAIYGAAASRATVLVRRPFLAGPAYGLCVFAAMQYVVVPLSRANFAPMPRWLVANGLLIHAIGVGLPIAVVTARWRQPTR